VAKAVGADDVARLMQDPREEKKADAPLKQLASQASISRPQAGSRRTKVSITAVIGGDGFYLSAFDTGGQVAMQPAFI